MDGKGRYTGNIFVERNRWKGEIHRTEYWYHCQEHPYSRLIHPQSCPTDGVHLNHLGFSPGKLLRLVVVQTLPIGMVRLNSGRPCP